MVSAPHDPVTVPTMPLVAPASPGNGKLRGKGRGRFSKGRGASDDKKPPLHTPIERVSEDQIESPTRRRRPANEDDHLLRSPTRDDYNSLEEGLPTPRQSTGTATSKPTRELPLVAFFTDPRFVVFAVFVLVFFLLFAVIILTFEPKQPATSIPTVAVTPPAPPATVPTEPPVTHVQQDSGSPTTPPATTMKALFQGDPEADNFNFFRM